MRFDSCSKQQVLVDKDHVPTIISSPTSVAQNGPHQDVEPIVLPPMAPQQVLLGSRSWKCPASAKSVRTINPIRAIVDPIAKNIQSGSQRGDGKDPISLAVSIIR